MSLHIKRLEQYFNITLIESSSKRKQCSLNQVIDIKHIKGDKCKKFITFYIYIFKLKNDIFLQKNEVKSIKFWYNDGGYQGYFHI